MGFKSFLREFLTIRKSVIVILTPLVLLPLPIVMNSTEGRCAYGLAIMAILWVTESLPLAATALLPVIIFPLSGVMKSSEVSSNYIKDASMFGVGGLTLAIAVEKWNLHKRIALRALMFVGSEPRWLMIGFMLPTWFLSLWMSNTATTAMMIPIVGAVMNELKRVKHSADEYLLHNVEERQGLYVRSTAKVIYVREKLRKKEKPGLIDENPQHPSDHYSKEDGNTSTDTALELEVKHPNNSENKTKVDEDEYTHICKGMALCVCYAANVGGTGSLSGTRPNMFLQGHADLIFQRHGLESSGVNFASWMVFALPGSLICVILIWLWLRLLYLGKRVQNTIRKAYADLGPMTFAEIAVLFHLVLLVVLWFSRDPPYVGGWGALFKQGYVGDSVSAIFISTSMFIFPSERPTVLCFRKKNVVNVSGGDTAKESRSVPALLDWETVHHKFPWGVLLLIGGGFALADACEKSGLSAWIGNELVTLEVLDPWQLCLVLTLVVSFCTEVTSNIATTTLLLPILGGLAEKLGLNPLYLMFPCTISASYAFMLPVATPPNAIAFASGYITVKDMVIAGSLMNFVCVGVLALQTNTLGIAYFKFDTLPQGFNSSLAMP